jgi:hypothetical protein
MNVHILLYVDPASKIRRYWNSSAILMNVADNGYGVTLIYRSSRMVSRREAGQGREDIPS